MIKPSVDMRDLPGKLIKASPAEQDRLLKGVHERFWHNSPRDMLRLLQAALLPKDIVLKGVQIARDCPICQSQQRHLHAPTIKSHLATTFNEIVQHDLFFMWDKVFMLLIDEAIRYKMGDHLENKLGPTLVRALYRIWIRFWGPPQHILSDQEGGLLSAEATRMFDRLSITRLLVGKDGTSTKGLVERHIALTKIAMLKLA